MIGRLNHVAIAVPVLASAADRWRDVLGANVSAPQALPEHGVTVVFVDTGNSRLLGSLHFRRVLRRPHALDKAIDRG